MEKLILEDLFAKEYARNRAEAEVYKKFSTNDGLKFVKKFFSDQMVNEISELYSLKLSSIGETIQIMKIMFSNGNYIIDTTNPTPNANSLEEAMSQLLTIIPAMLDSNGGTFTMIGAPRKISFINYASIVARFFNHLRVAKIKVEVEDTVIVEFEDSSKEEFLSVVEEFSKKINDIKSDDNVTRALISDVKVDLAALLNHLNNEQETFNFKDKLKNIKDIAAKSKPLWNAIGIASSVTGLLLAVL